MRSTTSARLAMCRAAVVGISRPLQITRRLLEKFSPSRPADAQDTVAVLPPTAKGCHGITGPKPGRPIDLCRGCLRWQGRAAASDHFLTNHTQQQGGGDVWCQDRIRA